MNEKLNLYLTEKYEILKQIASLSNQVISHIRARNIAEVDELLRRRRNLMAKIDSLDSVYLQHVNRELKQSEEPTLLGKIDQIRELLKGVIHKDKTIQNSLRESRDIIMGNIHKVKNAVKVQNSYQVKQRKQGRIVDRTK